MIDRDFGIGTNTEAHTEIARLKHRIAELEQTVAELRASKQDDTHSCRTPNGVCDNLVEHAVQGFLIFQNQRFVFANPAMETITGYRVDELLAMSAADIQALIHPEDREWVWHNIQQRARGEPAPTHYQYRLLYRDGSVRWVEKFVVVMQHEGQPASHVSLVDITEQKQMVDQLRFQTHLLGAVGQAIIATNLDGTIFYWNAAAERLYGWSANEVLGQNILHVTPIEQSHTEAETIMRTVGGGDEWTGEFRVRHRNGQSFHVLVTDVPFYDQSGTMIGIIGVSTDISHLKQIEAALHEERVRLQWVVEHAEDGFVIIDAQDTICYANQQACCYLELHDESLNRATFRTISSKHYHHYPPELWESWPEPLTNLVSPTSAQTPLRYLVRPETTTVPVLWLQVELLELPSEAQQQQLVRLRNITETMTTQQHMWTFHALISHKLNSPMSCLLNSLHLLHDSPDSHMSPNMREFVMIALESAQRLHNQFQRIRYFLSAPTLAQPGQGCLLMHLPQLIERISAEMEINLVCLEVPDNIKHESLVLALSVQAVALLLRQLLENARKFHPTHSPSIEVVLKLDTVSSVRITVSDDGTSLGPEQLPAAWTPYYQCEKGFSGQTPGMGLGLAIVASMLWSVGGQCHISNREPGPGVVVAMVIPFSQALL